MFHALSVEARRFLDNKRHARFDQQSPEHRHVCMLAESEREVGTPVEQLLSRDEARHASSPATRSATDRSVSLTPTISR
jgi:hypothetical protein